MVEKSEQISTFEEILARDGKLVYKTRGISMEPMLHQNRDLVIISVCPHRLKRFDVALYKRNESYVLHRVIHVREQDYLIRGDNTYRWETIPDKDILGVLTGFQRKGKYYDVLDRKYQWYVHIWNVIYPVRWLVFHMRRFLIATVRKLGILPLLKRIMGR